MKTFEKEYKELIRWYSEELKKVQYIPSSGLDGEHTQKERIIDDVYRNKLKELKRKHNVAQNKRPNP